LVTERLPETTRKLQKDKSTICKTASDTTGQQITRPETIILSVQKYTPKKQRGTKRRKGGRLAERFTTDT